ncbi:MAG: DUF4238 domain-containing protein [Acidobacteriaceae bacterium]
MANRTKKQHYIPQFLLRNFRIVGEDQLWVFDKRTSKAYKSPVRDVASERYYYDAKIEDGLTISFESRLGKIEADAAPVIATLVEHEDLTRMTPDEQAAVVVFLVAQIVRGKAWRASMAQAYDLLCEKLGGKEKAIFAGVPEQSEDEEKLAQLIDLPKTIKEYAPALLNKVWALQKTRSNQFLFIGDEPVVRQNSTPTEGVIGNRGLACDGIEIYLPLTPHLTLALLCPTLVAPVEAASTLPGAAGFEAERLLQSMKTGKPFLLTPANVTRLNALQVVHAERFIMSQRADFLQVEEMIRERPELRSTPRYVA